MQSIGQLDPSKDELLQIVFSRVDESMLREIAVADYGQDIDEHLKQLLAIKHGRVHVPMRWEPREVLELIRWSEPEDPTLKLEMFVRLVSNTATNCYPNDLYNSRLLAWQLFISSRIYFGIRSIRSLLILTET